MGIKCFCPHGHPLNVKSHLAGKRGVCPTCGVKFQIPEATVPSVPQNSATDPEESVFEPPEFAELKADLPSVNSPDGVRVSGDLAAGDNSPSAKRLSPGSGTKAAIWYVKTRDGQYGPTDEAAVREWVDGGRIVLGNWVWRDGWEQWRAAESVFSQLLPPTVNGSPTPTASPRVDTQITKDGSLPLGRAALRQRQGAKRRRILVICLSIVSVILLAALLILVVIQ